ncbi:MAG: hypothetical protein ABGW69_00505 [Nanoarchaeota archaeon]
MFGNNNPIGTIGKAILTVVLIGLGISLLVKWGGPLIEGVGSQIADSTGVNKTALTQYNDLANTAMTQTVNTSKTLFVFILVAAIGTIVLLGYIYIKSVSRE